MSDKNSIVIDGFIFENEAEAVQAAKEVEGIKHIKSKMEMDNPEMVLQIYNKIIQQQLFETAVGFAYLKDLQDYLISVPYVAKDAVLPIPVRHKALEISIRKKLKTPVKTVREKPKKAVEKRVSGYRMKYRVTLFLAVVMAVSMAGMFIITASSNNLNILNYESKIIDKYAGWEKQLQERESAVKMREEELGITYGE